MVSQDQIAAATIAQIFGSDLYKAQQSARTDSGNTPDFIKVHPRDILMQGQQQQSPQVKAAQERRLMEMLQREAEAACPLPEQPSSPPRQQTTNTDAQATPVAYPTQTKTSAPPPPQASTDVWSSIAKSLERIADRLDSVEITVKKKRMRRKNEANRQ